MSTTQKKTEVFLWNKSAFDYLKTKSITYTVFLLI